MSEQDTDPRGLIPNKFFVRRTDGTSAVGEKHETCRYFVLDLEHDENCVPALRAYAVACAKRRLKLSEDLLRLCIEIEHKQGTT